MATSRPDPTDVASSLISPTQPHVVVVFGGTGDLARRKLLPGLFHLSRVGLLPEVRIIGTTRDDRSDHDYRTFAAEACEEFRGPVDAAELDDFLSRVSVARLGDGPAALADHVAKAERELECEEGVEPLRLLYLSVPPQAALEVVALVEEAGLVDRSRIVMEKPFGTDLATARELNARLHETFDEEQIFRIDHFLGKEAALNILAFRFANGLFEPIWNREHIEYIQIDVPEASGIESRVSFYEATGAYRDMVVTHLFQVLAFLAMEPPTALAPAAIVEEKYKVFRSIQPIEPDDVVRGQFNGYLDLDGVARDSDVETFVALRCRIDNWRWAGVPFYLRTGKRLAEGARIISIAFREAPKAMFPAGSGIGEFGSDHLTFDLADSSRLSLSFYGKRPGPGLRLDKLSMQFALEGTGREGDVLEAYERLIHDAMSGDRTLFSTAEGIERLWELSTPYLAAPPPVRSYEPGSWGPNAIHQLIAPDAWRLPFERAWRQSSVE